MKHRCEICGRLGHKKLQPVSIGFRGELGSCESCIEALVEIVRKLQGGE